MNMMTGEEFKETLDATIMLPGVYISIIDEEPKERLLISVYKIDLHFEQDIITKKPNVTTEQRIELRIHHIQIDNMFARKAEYKVMFSPLKKLERSETEGVEPFIKVNLHKSGTGKIQTSKDSESSSLETFKLLELHIGEMQLKLHKATLLGIL